MLVGKPEGKRPLEDLGIGGNIRIDLKEIGSEGVDWIRVTENRDPW
jgi:hypothetical protein